MAGLRSWHAAPTSGWRTCILTFSVDKVEEHLQRAGQLQFLINVPLSRDALEQYDREVKYKWIYLPALYDELKLRLVRASYLHRVGDFEGA